MRPHNIPLVLLGAGMLWFGWFGFNAGSALSAGHLATVAMINTQVATAAAAMSWTAFEKWRDGKPTTLGVASGVAKEALKGSAVGFIAEAPTEALEQVLERWQAGLPLTGKDAIEPPAAAGGFFFAHAALRRTLTLHESEESGEIALIGKVDGT